MHSDLAAAALVGLAGRGVLAVAVLRKGRIEWASPALRHMFGLQAAEALGKPFLELVAAEDREALARALDETPGATSPSNRFRGARADGSLFDGELTCAAFELPGGPGAVVAARDVSEQRRAEVRLAELAFQDSLTELPNRALFFDRLRQALVDARRHGSAFAVLVGDIDGLKRINDSHGHETGDALLQVVAKRLRSATREGDTVARVGGDEFAALLPRAASAEDASIVAMRMVRALDPPIVIAGKQCQVGISLGIALYPTHGKDTDALVAHADGAMYIAKRAGGRRFEFARLRDPDISGPLRLPAFEWYEARLVGVASMDEQHKDLATLINRLGEELKAGQEVDKLSESLGRLANAARAHFAHEEWLLAGAGLGVAAERHRQENSRLLEDLERQSLDLDRKSMALTMRYLNGWLARHIEADRHYAKQLVERGLHV
jgi:diguanylate cyclase (GGDEF)-like protein/hemerythrin-like metal-binding protein/PAS domain S-box-containing protein